ncbi:hypothetical protein [Pelagibacterium halotolerans]|uniref:Uncharacterized protein n=1 Tax=Pelagibacterium halotolerans (strain DSM 22347 / JCM 15775 / CGMCC 1.7692 / B2) TaxID=1082931 RepID=G4RAH3_PELHB|nr:hypothetical protein [Pelagibacterium halotolerans]AEQ51523.1 hypothetical protein KKY_1505 [Pelagibacterium halotolerans B2]QJR18640.1 hypothetical protein HKM20_09445 [Pelagibacterium halotolerans]SEA15889.1 hypothetical protein SAMN05428936_102142 [Pelagibacterium halotolerans]
MKFFRYLLPLSLILVLAGAGGAIAQPQTKLVQDLPKSLIQAIWCSALFFEESYYYDEGSEDMAHYEDLAFDLGADIDTVLLEDHGLRQEEVDEIWSVFDSGAYDLTMEDDESFLAQLELCESAYDELL